MQRPLLQWGFAAAALVLLVVGGLLVRENSRLHFEMSQSQANQNELLERESELQLRETKLRNEISSQSAIGSETEQELAKVRKEREKLQQELIKSKQQIVDQKRFEEKQRTEAKKQKTSAPSRQVSIATFILSPTLRGNNQLQELSIPTNTVSARMRLELESDDFPVYRVALQNSADGRTVWQSGRIKSKMNGQAQNLDC